MTRRGQISNSATTWSGFGADYREATGHRVGRDSTPQRVSRPYPRRSLGDDRQSQIIAIAAPIIGGEGVAADGQSAAVGQIAEGADDRRGSTVVDDGEWSPRRQRATAEIAHDDLRPEINRGPLNDHLVGRHRSAIKLNFESAVGVKGERVEEGENTDHIRAGPGRQHCPRTSAGPDYDRTTNDSRTTKGSWVCLNFPRAGAGAGRVINEQRTASDRRAPRIGVGIGQSKCAGTALVKLAARTVNDSAGIGYDARESRVQIISSCSQTVGAKKNEAIAFKRSDRNARNSLTAYVQVTIAEDFHARGVAAGFRRENNARAGARSGPSISNERSGISAGFMKRELCTMAAKDRSAVVDDRAGTGTWFPKLDQTSRAAKDCAATVDQSCTAGISFIETDRVVVIQNGGLASGRSGGKSNVGRIDVGSAARAATRPGRFGPGKANTAIDKSDQTGRSRPFLESEAPAKSLLDAWVIEYTAAIKNEVARDGVTTRAGIELDGMDTGACRCDGRGRRGTEHRPLWLVVRDPGGIPISGVVPIAVGRAKAPGIGRMRQFRPGVDFRDGTVDEKNNWEAQS